MSTVSDLRFNGSNWEDLDRLVALCTFAFTRDDVYDDTPRAQCALLAAHFEGPALDWAASTMSATAATMDSFTGYVAACKQAFGVADADITALRRAQLERLHVGSDVPVFFAEFDRLTLQLGITDHGTKIVMVRDKLPLTTKVLLAEQALDFANYDTMRERLITMWALDPKRQVDAIPTRTTRRPRCGRCGKKGHTASDCRGSPKN